MDKRAIRERLEDLVAEGGDVPRAFRDASFRQGDGPTEDPRLRAFFVREIHVATAHRDSVGLPHDGAADYLDGQRHVRRHASDDR